MAQNNIASVRESSKPLDKDSFARKTLSALLVFRQALESSMLCCLIFSSPKHMFSVPFFIASVIFLILYQQKQCFYLQIPCLTGAFLTHTFRILIVNLMVLMYRRQFLLTIMSPW